MDVGNSIFHSSSGYGLYALNYPCGLAKRKRQHVILSQKLKYMVHGIEISQYIKLKMLQEITVEPCFY